MNRRITVLIAAVAALAAVAVLRAGHSAWVPWWPPCVFHELTGLHCPGCGTTRALEQLARGHPGAALGLNPLTVLLLPLLGWWTVRRREILWRPWLGWTLLGVVVVFGIMRNVPQYPFTLLAP